MAQFHHTGLTVSNLERALAFWSDALGAEIVMQQDRQGGYFEEIVGEHGVDVRTRAARVRRRGPAHRAVRVPLAARRARRGRTADVGFAHVCVTCDDLDAMLERLVAAGGRPVSEPVDVDTGANAGGRAVYVRDPDGHTVELFTPPAT